MGSKQHRSFWERTAERVDLPVDTLGGLPIIELIGRRELRMAHHRGILTYAGDEICISSGKLTVTVRGTQLDLKAMNADELVISGEIRSVLLD